MDKLSQTQTRRQNAKKPKKTKRQETQKRQNTDFKFAAFK